MTQASLPHIIWKDESASAQDESSKIDSTSKPENVSRITLISDLNPSRCNYEKQLTDMIKRKLDAQEEATFELVKKTYHFQKQIGKGSSGVVHLVYHKDLNQRFACKVIEKSGPINDLQSMRTEIEILKRVKHPRVVMLHELYESPKCMWLILELVEAGGLRSKLTTIKRKFPENLSAKLTRQILEGVQYLHSLGIVHRDIKIDNILFQGNVLTGSVKIADFGLSAVIKADDIYPKTVAERKKYRGLKSAWGTPTHYSPELISGTYGPQTDMWSLGCVVYEMLTGFNAFPPSKTRADQHRHKDLFRRIKSCNYKRSHLASFSPICKDFISKLLELDPVHRMSPEEAMNHPWVALQNAALDSKPRNASMHINPLKLLSCIRSRSPAPYPDSPEKEKNKSDSRLSESVTGLSDLDVEGPKKDYYLTLNNSNCNINSNTTSNTTSTNTSAVGSPTHSSSAIRIQINHPSQLKTLDLNTSSPDRKKSSNDKGFFKKLYSAVRYKDGAHRQPDTPCDIHHN